MNYHKILLVAIYILILIKKQNFNYQIDQKKILILTLIVVKIQIFRRKIKNKMQVFGIVLNNQFF
ncbi:unnamed protein product [Paramecium pentaurelia]|uniref:Transmembrane protein n=1 Tax=Paramecium pentaurelia TaxID=43138 RepID=A0A8S1SX53_9CILI|nr:unnamed protein product [Paramecium pentaurelia]